MRDFEILYRRDLYFIKEDYLHSARNTLRRVRGHYLSHLDDRVFDKTNLITETIVVALDFCNTRSGSFLLRVKSEFERKNSYVGAKGTGTVIRQASCCFE